MKSFKNATNTDAVVTVAAVALRVNIIIGEVEAETESGVGRMERTRPIEAESAFAVNSRTISVTTNREEDMNITVSN